MTSRPPTASSAASDWGARPQLTRRQRRAAWIAGILGLLLTELGLLGVVSVVVVAWVLVVVAGVDGYGSVSYDPQLGPVAALDVGWQAIAAAPSALGAPFWVFGGGGVAVVLLAVTVSALILRVGRVHRPWRVSWSATGVSVFAVSLIYLALSYLSNAGTKLLPSGNWPAFRIYLVLTFIVVAIVTVVVGAGTWWWMSHVLRAPQRATATRTARRKSRTAPR